MLINSCPDLNDDHQNAHAACGLECEECFHVDADCPDCSEWASCTCFDDDDDYEDDDLYNLHAGDL